MFPCFIVCKWFTQITLTYLKTKLKHLFQSGKTTIANFLADATESTGGEYHPTEGVRILQFESANINVNNQSVKAEVELWDCSGDRK